MGGEEAARRNTVWSICGYGRKEEGGGATYDGRGREAYMEAASGISKWWEGGGTMGGGRRVHIWGGDRGLLSYVGIHQMPYMPYIRKEI